jgi:hypothetical protein
MSSKTQLYFIIGLLCLMGGLGIIYKRVAVGYPLLPKQSVPVWVVEAQVQFKADGGSAKVSMAAPGDQASLGLLNEEAVSVGYGFTPAAKEKEGINPLHRRVVWARSDAEGIQYLYYRVLVYKKLRKQDLGPLLTVPPPIDPAYKEEPLSTAVQAIVEDAKLHSADPASLTSYVIGQFIQKDPSQNVRFVLREKSSELDQAEAIQQVLLAAGVEAHLIRGLHLAESQKHQKLVPALLIKTGKESWEAFLADRPQPGLPTPFLAWQRGGASLVDVTGGKDAKIRFSVLRDRRPLLGVVEESAKQAGRRFAEFSIYNLPLEQQNAFRMLLMIPLGALVVVMLRNLVGLKTSGTFMPILLAMSFLQTQLITGLVIFFMVVGAGLVVRSYLSRLDLLLVPRISAVVVVVIGIMAATSIIGHMLQLEFARSVTLFPTIILAWTVERLSILWDEDGPKEVAIQTGGSLITAIGCYFVMGSTVLQYLIFTFPEFLLIVLAVILMLGQYTGYRLSELQRFGPMAKEEDA